MLIKLLQDAKNSQISSLQSSSKDFKGSVSGFIDQRTDVLLDL